MTELLALVNIGDVHFDDWCRNGTDGIVQRYAGMRIGSGIQDDAIGLEATSVYAVDELALAVALEIIELHIGVTQTKLFEIILEGTRAIDSRLTTSKEVEIRAVDDLNYFHCRNSG